MSAHFDEEGFVLDAAAGMDESELAQRYGVSPRHIKRLRLGVRRAHLAKRISELQRHRRRLTLLRLLRLQHKATVTLERALQRDDAVAVRAAHDILRRTMD